ncbi:TPA: HK97-gp10 family putative phage morphogenesis protein [Escherichia coli]
MADGVDFSIIGVEALLGKLSSVSDDLRRRGGRAALRRAGNVIVEKAKENARRIDDPHTGRSIADNVAMRWNGRLFKTTGNPGHASDYRWWPELLANPRLGRYHRYP